MEFKETPKIDLSTKKAFFVFDDYCKSIIGSFVSPAKANIYIQKLVKRDIKMLIKNLRLMIMLSDKDDEEDVKLNKERITTIKNLLYTLKTMEQSKDTMINYGEKRILRYLVMSSNQLDEPDEENYQIIY